jgi:hypothetical protein
MSTRSSLLTVDFSSRFTLISFLLSNHFLEIWYLLPDENKIKVETPKTIPTRNTVKRSLFYFHK